MVLEPLSWRVLRHHPEMRACAKTTRNWIDHFPNPAAAVETAEIERRAELESRWATGGPGFLGAFADLLVDHEANETAAELIRSRIREVVEAPEVARLLVPHSTFGCKRLCVDTGYFETCNRPNVTLVGVSGAPIERIVPEGPAVEDALYELDALVLATGFDAMTGTLRRIDIRGRSGRKLADKWVEGPRMYLGLASAGFPNLFTITGPGSPSVPSNVLPSIERHMEWVADLLEHARGSGGRSSKRRLGPRTPGSRTPATLRAGPSTPRAARGTWVRTFRASLGCSCRTRGFPPAPASARKWPRAATRDSR